MITRILAVLLSLVLALVGIDYLLSHKEKQQAQVAGLLFPGLIDSEDVWAFSYRTAHTQPATEFKAEKTSDGFIITRPKLTPAAKADGHAIRAMVELIAGVRYKRKLDADQSDPVYGLERPQVAFGIKTSGGDHQLIIGERTPASYDRYAAIVGQPEVYVIDDSLYMAADKKLLAFRDRRVINVPLAKLRRLDYRRNGAEGFAATVTRNGGGWLLKDGGVGSADDNSSAEKASTSRLVDFVTALNALRAQRIVDTPSQALLKAYKLDKTPTQGTKGTKGPRSLAEMTFAIAEGAGGLGEDTKLHLTVIERNGSLIAYSDPAKRLYILPATAKEQLLMSRDELRFRQVFSLDWAKITEVKVANRRYQKSATGTGTWLDADDSTRLVTLPLKTLLIDLEFAKATAMTTEAPKGYTDSPKIAMELIWPGGSQAFEVVRVGGQGIIHTPSGPTAGRYYHVSLATIRHLLPLLGGQP